MASPLRPAALTLAGLRIAYGAALVVATNRTGKPWLGEDAGSPAAHVALRGVGAREIAVHTALIGAVLADQPLRPWLAASIAGDLSDIAMTAVSRKGLPDGATGKTAAVAGISALLSAGVLLATER